MSATAQPGTALITRTRAGAPAGGDPKEALT